MWDAVLVWFLCKGFKETKVCWFLFPASRAFFFSHVHFIAKRRISVCVTCSPVRQEKLSLRVYTAHKPALTFKLCVTAQLFCGKRLLLFLFLIFLLCPAEPFSVFYPWHLSLHSLHRTASSFGVFSGTSFVFHCWSCDRRCYQIDWNERVGSGPASFKDDPNEPPHDRGSPPSGEKVELTQEDRNQQEVC